MKKMTSIPKQEQQNNNVDLVQLVSALVTSGKKSQSEIDEQKLLYECANTHRSRLEKENEKLKSELKENKSELEELKDQVSCLAGEKNVWCQKAEIMEKREKGLFERVNNANIRCAQLEREKELAVADVEMWKRRFLYLDERVSHLEGDALSLSNLLGLDAGDNSDLPTRGIGVQPPAPDVVIIESDDEAPPDLTASKTQASDLNGTPGLKRKLFSSAGTNGNNPEANSLSSRSKMKKLPEFIPPSGSSAANQGSTAAMSSASSNSSKSEDHVNVNGLLPTNHTKKSKMWGSREEMQAAIEKDDELSLMAMCALYREHIFFKNLLLEFFPGLSCSDACRGIKLAEYLIDGNQSGRLMKSVKDLIKNDAKGLDDCKRITMALSKPLYEIYEKGDPLFHHLVFY